MQFVYTAGCCYLHFDISYTCKYTEIVQSRYVCNIVWINQVGLHLYFGDKLFNVTFNYVSNF